MALQVARGLIEALSSWAVASTQDYSVGFDPSVVILFELGGTLDANNGGAHAAVGAFDAAGNNACATADAVDNALTAATASVVLSNRCYVRRTNTAGERGILTGSMISGGFRLTVNDPFDVGAPRRLGYLAIGGLTGAKVGTATMPTGTGDFDVTGVGFNSPDAVLFAMGPHSVAIGTASTNVGDFSIGAWANGKQAVAAFETANGATASADSLYNEANVLARIDATAGTLQTAVSYVTGITDGFRLNKSAGANASGFLYIALKGVTADLNFEAARTTTGAITRSSLAAQPHVLLAFSTFQATASQSSPTPDAKLAIGVGLAAANRHAMATLDTDALDPTDNALRGTEGSFLLELTRTGADTFAVDAEIEITSFGASSYTLDQVDASAAAYRVAVLALMESAGAVTGTGTMALGGLATAASGTHTPPGGGPSPFLFRRRR